MTAYALALVLTAAALHAGWNAALKAFDDRGAILAAVSACHACVGLILVLSVPAPAPAAWPYIAASSVLHYGYYALLFRAYRLGDLSLIYPVSRGMAPATVALLAALTIGEQLTTGGWIGVFAVSFGVFVLAFGKTPGTPKAQPLLLAVALGLLIAAYSVSDGIGVRLSGSVAGYIGWLFLFEFPVPLAIALTRLKARRGMNAKVLAVGMLGGLAAVTAYGTVLYAKTIAPLGAVSAVRESSVVFAALIGVFLFGERPWQLRMAAASIIAFGIVTLSIAT